MNKKYEMALSEVKQILNQSDEEIIRKIPQNFLRYVKDNADSEYELKIEKNKKLTEQNIMKETKEILALIYRDYLCTKEEREKLIKQEQEEREKIEKEKQEKYNIDFEKIANGRKQKNLIEKLEIESEKSLIEVSDEKWYQKIIHNILKIFKIK